VSKISLSSNPSGNGIFTIASPNSNTNRTLTLPDATGTVNVSGLANEVPAGSAGAPAIYPTGDTNTGIFFPAADTIAFAEGGVESMRIDSAGRVTMPLQPAFGAYSTAVMGGGASGVFAVFNTVYLNRGSSYNASNGRFTAPVTGVYQINFQGISTNSAGGAPPYSPIHIELWVNGVQVTGTSPYSQSSPSYDSLTMAVVVPMNAGDYANIRIEQGYLYGDNANVHNNFSGHLIG
jgi:hypothetical protein